MTGQSQRDIRRRIRSVKSTQQITRAMELVSAAKLRRAQVRLEEGRPFSEKLHEVLSRLRNTSKTPLQHPLLQRREMRRVAYLVVTADRGLAGGYNANVIKRALEVLREEEHPFDLLVIGRVGRDALRKQDFVFAKEYLNLGDDIDWPDVRDIARDFTTAYNDGTVDAMFLVYTEFVNTLVHRPVVKQLLPVEYPDASTPIHAGGEMEEPGNKEVDYIFEPSPAAVLECLLPRYVETVLYEALLTAKASEHGARMAAMHNATDNAEKMIEALTLSFNRARQASITSEITEIVGGSNALAEGAW